MASRLPRVLDVGTSYLASILRGGRGLAVSGAAHRQPQQPIELYEFEACPYGRLVREALTALDLDALIHPCPEGGQRFRPIVQAKGGKMQFPFLVDPNTGRSLYESAEIIGYLSETYGGNARPSAGLGRKLSIAGSYLATGVRMPRGLRARPSRAPAKPLELYSFDASPYCRLAREILCELELPYLLRNCGSGSRNRNNLQTRAGKVQVPYLIDPNTGKEMFESAQIIRYLEQAYATPTA